MGLKIQNFKSVGQSYIDAYAKISNVRYNNDNKIANFDLAIYISKEDKNLIKTVKNLWCKITSGTDMVAQCYTKINTIISQTNAQITALQNEIDAIVGDDNLKFRKESMLNQMKNNELLQFENSVEW